MNEQFVTLKNEALTVTVSTLGAEIRSVKGKNGTEFIWDANPDVWAKSCPILFPICGGLKNDTYLYNGKEYILEKHGFTQQSYFEIESATEEKAVLVLRATEETKKSYPFDFVLRAVFVLDESTLAVFFYVENAGENTMYFSIGAHEGYACPEGIESYTVHFEEEEQFARTILDGNLLTKETECVNAPGHDLPLKKEFFAIDALVFESLKSRKVTLSKNDSTKKVTLTFPGHDYFLLWTKPSGEYICMEPWCGIPDKVGSGFEIEKKEGILSVEPGKTHLAAHTMTFEE